MNASVRSFSSRAALSAALLAAALSARAASADPYLAYAYPAGGRAGTSFRIVAAGQSLKGASDVLVTGGGVRAGVLDYVGAGGPLSGVQEEYLKYRLDALSKEKSGAKAAADAAAKEPPAAVDLPDLPDLRGLESKTSAELKLLYSRYIDRNTRPKAPMNETVEIAVVLDPGAQPGTRELRVLAAGGLSNPIVFRVGSLPEYVEPDRFDPPGAAAPAPLEVPVTVNGRVMPGEVDSYGIRLRAGQEIACAASARSLLPYLADAVPGWFQAVMSIGDAEGRELAYCDDVGNDPDPAIRFKAPSDGTYTISIRDSIYRGRFDFVYRLEIAEPGSGAPRSAATRPAATRPAAQAGIISRPGEVDSYALKGKAGDVVAIETRAARDGSPLDTILRLVGPEGRVAAMNDDFEDKEAGLVTRQSDSWLLATLPAAGTYSVQVSDATGRGGPEYAYSLRMGPPAPDFSAISDRSTINIPQYGSGLFAVQVIRKDGWDGDVEVALKDPPPGLSLEGGIIPKGRDLERMTLSFSGGAPAIPIGIELEARAVVGGKAVAHAVSAADRVMQAFANYHYVPSDRLRVAFSRSRGKATQVSVPPGTVAVAPGGRAEIEASISPKPAYPLILELVEAPEGLSLAATRTTERGIVLEIQADAGAAPFAGNLIIRATGVTQAKDKTGASIEKKEELGYLPAIRVAVAAR
jgi:hypothetical protein